MTKILTRNEKFQVNYQQQILSDFFYKQPGDCDFSTVIPTVEFSDLTHLFGKARIKIMIACDCLNEERLIKSLQDKADEGIRIYLLLGDKKNNQTAIDRLSGRCHIRTGVTQQGALLLLDHSTFQAQGKLFTSSAVFNGISNKSQKIELELPQIDDSYRSFCKLFWEHATDEYLEHNKSHKVVKNPNGSIVVNHSHQLYGTLQDCLSNTLSSLSAACCADLDHPVQPDKLLLTSDSTAIASKASSGVALTETVIPSLLFSDKGNWLLPSSADFSVTNWCLKLSNKQNDNIFATYNQALSEAAWQYKKEIKLRDLAEQQVIRFSDQPEKKYTVEQLQEIKLNDEYTKDIDVFLDNTAQDLSKNQTRWRREVVVHQVNYSIKIHPPYCPQQAKKDELYQSWQRAEDNWQNRLSELEARQNSINQRQKSIADSLKGFIKGFLLGQGQSVKKLDQEITTLRGWSVTTATPAGREEYTKRLSVLSDQIEQRDKDTKLRLDEAKQNQRWEQDKSKLEDAINKSKILEQEKKVIFKKQAEARIELIAKAEQDFNTSWKGACKNLEAEQLDKLELKGVGLGLPNSNEEAVKESDTTAIDEKHKAKIQALSNMTIEQAKEWKNTIKEKIWKKHYPLFAKALTNYDLTIQKVERDIQQAEKEWKQSYEQQQQAEKALKNHGHAFTYQQSKYSNALDSQLGLTKDDKKQGKFTWPAEDLPSDQTELRQHQQKRYLVITNKEELEQARVDAARLKAEIVCDKEVVNA